MVQRLQRNSHHSIELQQLPSNEATYTIIIRDLCKFGMISLVRPSRIEI